MAQTSNPTCNELFPKASTNFTNWWSMITMFWDCSNNLRYFIVVSEPENGCARRLLVASCIHGVGMYAS